jgi:hypothetical protein
VAELDLTPKKMESKNTTAASSDSWIQRHTIEVGIAIYLFVAILSLFPSILDRYYLRTLRGPEFYRTLEWINGAAPLHLKPEAVFLVFGIAQYVYLIPVVLILAIARQFRLLKIVATCSLVIFLLNAIACGVLAYGLRKIG